MKIIRRIRKRSSQRDGCCTSKLANKINRSTSFTSAILILLSCLFKSDAFITSSSQSKSIRIHIGHRSNKCCSPTRIYSSMNNNNSYKNDDDDEDVTKKYIDLDERIQNNDINDMKQNSLMTNSQQQLQPSSRRKALQVIAAATGAAITMSSSPIIANAGVAEIDAKTGSLYSPKKEMLGGGGSDLARGIKLQSRNRDSSSSSSSSSPSSSNTIRQTVYETRFITYLSRFLLNYDPAAKSWWKEQEFDEMGKMSVESQKKLRFAEFAESVEVGLADYFVGPYGSYASVKAAMAGLQASAPATSSSSGFATDSNFKSNFFDTIKRIKGPSFTRNNNQSGDKAVGLAKQGVLNLFSLLKARYTTIEQKKQLAILFSLISSDDRLQPTAEIKSLLGEVDNGKITAVKLEGLLDRDVSQIDARSSSHRGGGYSYNERPTVTIDPPPSLGDEYKPAKLEPVMEQTSRILRIRVLDGGKGYTSIPRVEVVQNGVTVNCEACAILDRKGSVESVVVLNPGFGYGNGDDTSTVEVRIAPPKKFRLKKPREKDLTDDLRPAIAIADLEYAIRDVRIVQAGNGYAITEPPNLYVSAPNEEPDWYMKPIDQKTWQVNDLDQVEASVYSMTSCNNGNSYFMDDDNISEYELLRTNPTILRNLENDPLALFPCTLRPYFISSSIAESKGVYSILSLPIQSTSIILPSPRYRAYDSVFGGIGAKPVVKGAQTLTGSEYARIALSGAWCTVIVRTALNPLELVKTKVQLQNDEELIKAVESSNSAARKSDQNSNEETTGSTKLGTIDVMKSLIQIRGPMSLFQSADITFLASVVFGSFGFGATELFRRYFTSFFFSEGGGTKGSEEVTLLLAAAIACILTSLAAAPFELIRVRSMAYVNANSLKTVFFDFLNENRAQGRMKQQTKENITFKDINVNDVKPLFSGFYPIVSRELPFAVIKFLAFDLIATSTMAAINSQPQVIEPIQVGSGTIGLTVSAVSGAIAGLFGAFVSHPADLILTLTSSQKRSDETSEEESDWKSIVQDLIQKEGGVFNLYAGFPARASFFFLVIGLQFFLYDYAKTVFQVGSDDLTLVLDVFYAIRQGLVEMSSGM